MKFSNVTNVQRVQQSLISNSHSNVEAWDVFDHKSYNTFYKAFKLSIGNVNKIPNGIMGLLMAATVA